MACARIGSSGKAVTKMIGMRRPCANSSRCSSMPLRPGICKSVITQDVSFTCEDCRNSSAEGKVHAPRPSDLTRLLTEERTNSSSSMIEMIGGLGNGSSSASGRGGKIAAAETSHDRKICHPGQHEKSYLSITLSQQLSGHHRCPPAWCD